MKITYHKGTVIYILYLLIKFLDFLDVALTCAEHGDGPALHRAKNEMRIFLNAERTKLQ